MIIIFSSEGDANSNYLIEWLTFYNCPFKRINLDKEDFRNIKLYISNESHNIELKLKCLSAISHKLISHIGHFPVPTMDACYNQPIKDVLSKVSSIDTIAEFI